MPSWPRDEDEEDNEFEARGRSRRAALSAYPDGRELKHSGLGMASFIIALVVGGLDVILIIAVTPNIADSGWRVTPSDLHDRVVVGGMSLIFLNCASLPLCLVGLGLSIVALIAHPNRNHMFTWIGLWGNGVVIFGVAALFFLGRGDVDWALGAAILAILGAAALYFLDTIRMRSATRYTERETERT